jgi:hypothetical protein
MPQPTQSRALWRKSSYSNGTGGSCVEVAALSRKDGRESEDHVELVPFTSRMDDPERLIAVRDSKDPHGPMLAFNPREWAAFTAVIKSGRLGEA